jgi:hypothetical protein
VDKHVDPTRRDDQTGTIDFAVARSRAESYADLNHASVCDASIGNLVESHGGVEQAPVAKQHTAAHDGSAGRAKKDPEIV